MKTSRLVCLAFANLVGLQAEEPHLAIGPKPAIAPFNVAGVLADPILTIFGANWSTVAAAAKNDGSSAGFPPATARIESGCDTLPPRVCSSAGRRSHLPTNFSATWPAPFPYVFRILPLA